MLPTLAYGDAIGNHVLEIRDLLRAWGYSSEIFAERWHPRLAKECRPFREYRRFSHPDNLLFWHYSISGEVNRFALALPDRVVLYYHNITPAHFFYGVNGELARQLDEARQGLAALATRVQAIAASTFNRQELEKLGFQVLATVPYILNFESLDRGARGREGQEIRRRFGGNGTADWLYVGRLAPNKCIQDLVKAFYYYHHWIHPASRLLLVGTGEGMDSYVRDLYRLVTRLDLDGSVAFVGHYGGLDGLAAFYQMASLYVSMSEHEGFCIPLVEAMYYDLPVIAYASTGVPITMGDAGVLVHEKDYPAIAEMAHELASNTDLRDRILVGQRTRLRDHGADKARTMFRQALDGLEA